MQSTEDFFAKCDDLVLREILKHIGDDPLTLRLLRATCKRWRELVAFDNDIPRIADESIMRVRRENIVWWARKLVSRNDFDAFRLLLREFIGSHRFEQTGLDFARFSSRILRKTIGAQDDRFARELLPYCTFNGERADSRMTTKLWSERAGASMVHSLLLSNRIIARMFALWGNECVRAFMDECDIFSRKIDWDKPLINGPSMWSPIWQSCDRARKRVQMVYAIRREIARGSVINDIPPEFARYIVGVFRESMLSSPIYPSYMSTFLEVSLPYLAKFEKSLFSRELFDYISEFLGTVARVINHYLHDLNFCLRGTSVIFPHCVRIPQIAYNSIIRFTKFTYFRDCISIYCDAPFEAAYKQFIADVYHNPHNWVHILFRAKYDDFAQETIDSDRNVSLYNTDLMYLDSDFAFKMYNEIPSAIFERIIAKICHIEDSVAEYLMRAIAIGRLNHILRYPAHIARAFATAKMCAQYALNSRHVVNYDFLYDDYRRKKLISS